MQKDSHILDDLARMVSGAAGSMMDVGREIEAAVARQMEKWAQRMQLVTREEFDTAMEMLQKSRTEQDELKQRLAALEARLAKTDSL